MISRRAVIDIGTNSVKLLVGDVDGAAVHPVHETSEQTRLGAGFYAHRQLQPDAIARTASAAKGFADLARRHRASAIRLIATSAARDAHNRHELVEAVRRETGFDLEIIAGEQEAAWVCRGVGTDPTLAGRPMVIMDAGGGSTEFVVGANGAARFRQSFALGTVRWLEHSPVADPPSETDATRLDQHLAELFREEILPAISPHLSTATGGPWLGVGTSGTATILARLHHRLDSYDRDQLDGTLLSAAEVRSWRDRLWSVSLQERRKIPGLPPERADVILPGVSIYEAALRHLGLETLHLTLRGLRFAALLDAPE